MLTLSRSRKFNGLVALFFLILPTVHWLLPSASECKNTTDNIPCWLRMQLIESVEKWEFLVSFIGIIGILLVNVSLYFLSPKFILKFRNWNSYQNEATSLKDEIANIFRDKNTGLTKENSLTSVTTYFNDIGASTQSKKVGEIASSEWNTSLPSMIAQTSVRKKYKEIAFEHGKELTDPSRPNRRVIIFIFLLTSTFLVFLPMAVRFFSFLKFVIGG